MPMRNVVTVAGLTLVLAATQVSTAFAATHRHHHRHNRYVEREVYTHAAPPVWSNEFWGGDQLGYYGAHHGYYRYY